MTNFSIDPCFIDAPQGRIFVVSYIPSGMLPHGAVILVPPFAEEMNKARRMFSLVAKSLASSGFCVVLPDFYGTGDSEGDFSDSSWSGWLEQLRCCADQLKSKFGVERYSLLALRAGALLAVEYLRYHRSDVQNLVLWQPVQDGDVYLTQFLRLRLASGMLSGSQSKESTQSLKQKLEGGEEVEVAGYGLKSAVTDGMMASSLSAVDTGNLPPILWIDLVSAEGQSPPLISRKQTQRWIEEGVELKYVSCVGEPFWGSVETVDVPEMVALSVAYICGDASNVG